MKEYRLNPLLDFMEETADDAHKGHRARLREKAYRLGVEQLPAHEIIELMLFCAIRRGNTNDVAHALIEAFGSLKSVLNASEAELLRVHGMGKRAAGVILAFGNAVRSYQRLLNGRKYIIRTRGDAVAFAEELFNDEIRPQTWLLLLGHEGNIIHISQLFAGAMWLNDNTREYIIRCALTSGAHFAVMMAHRGLDIHSILPVDRMMMHELAQSLVSVGVSVLDYLVVTPYRTISLRRDVEMGRSPFDISEFGKNVREVWMSDPGAVWEAGEDRNVEISAAFMRGEE